MEGEKGGQVHQRSGSVHGTELKGSYHSKRNQAAEAGRTRTKSVISFLIGADDPTLTTAVPSIWPEV